ncbi:Retrovirus-related Pol polyprotein from transposon RE2 [Vitis vinifera]|uniref:Retrovirus-related Pol polyprotein from transposon RE2 n=1 Tax=Vitis vinifera TaxID=29760 RepID=A0A438HIT4_VITVI|nr:Retrovirus-related Pol polyprotein from transposon RE2 [Vitis vinifera]
MATKTSIFSSVISGSPMITSEKLVGSENYLSWFASIELWFMGQGYEDHLVTQEADIPELDKFFMVLTLIGLRPDLEPVRDQILGSSSVPSLDDVFARLLHISSTQTLPSDSISNSSVLVSHTTSRGGRSAASASELLRISGISGFCCLCCPAWTGVRGRRLAIGRESQGLYHLTSDSSPAVCISTDAPLLIHNHLGYPSLSKFQKMVPRFSTLSSLSCESCQLGKHTRVSFPKRLNNRAKSPFELVHTDVWGPCRTASTLGFQYFVTFIDDYSRSPFTSFMSHHGILHQSSCAHIPQQNGVAERKNRHLIETARTILLHSNIPHFLLFPDQPLYFLPPRVFGYFRRVIVVISLETHRYFISADVTFFEDSPFFSTTSESLPVSDVLPLPIVSPSDVVPPRPLQVYHRRPRVAALLPFAEAPADSLPIPSASSAPALPSPDDLPIAIRKVGCRWVYAVKVSPDGQVDRLKARLVAKGYTQLDIKNAFLHGDLAEEVYMEQPPGFVAQGESGLVCSTADHSVFYHHNSLGQCIYLVVYVDDIVITGSDQDAQSSSGVVLSKMKYALDILEETGMLDCKPINTHMDPNVKLVPGQGEPLGDPGRYRRLVGKLNYLTITRPDISFPVSVVSQFLQSPCDSHWDAVIRILRYIKSTPGQGVLYENRGHTQVVGYTDADWAGSPTNRHSTSGYCVFIGGNLISWKSKKQNVVVRSSVEAEYRAMALATCELIWLRHLLRELRFGKDEQMKLICDNQAVLHITSNPVFHERTKHIEVDCHFIREKIASGCVATSFVNSNDQLADIFTKFLRGPRIKYICNKLGAYDVYAPA